MQRLFRWLFIATVAAALVQTAYHATHLPDRVAMHFDLAGKANGWGSRDTHIAFQAGLVVFVAALFGAMGWLFRRLPDHLINLPHREYWLEPERREESLGALAGMLQVCGCVVLGFFMVFFHQIYAANLSGRLQLQLLPLLISQFVLLAATVTALMFRFRRPQVQR